MALSVVRAADGRDLADALAQRLQVPLADPLATEEVVVHSRGMERWLAQHLSRRLGQGTGGDGICANVAFPFPIDVVRRAIRAAGGPDPRRSTWAPDRLVWPLLAVVEGGLGDWASPLTDRLARDPDQRIVVLRRIADLIDRYAVHQPDMVLAWLAGEDVDAAGQPLDTADRWQPQLLRTVRAAVDQPTLAESVVQVGAGLTRPDDIPSRISAFGFTALPAAHLAVMVALAGVVDVDLYLLHPSPGLWAAWEGLAGGLDARGLPVLPHRGELGAPPPRNRLLRSWGRDASEMQVVVASIAGDTPVTLLDDRLAPSTASSSATLLGRIQAAVRDDVHLPDDSVVGGTDTSLQVHACHGRTRQVQVLRDEILRLLAGDPTLEPRDIIVMCPDVETFAPLVNAHLAIPQEDPDGRPDLRVRLADRALRQVNPLLRVLDDLLALAAGRVTVSRLLDLAGSAPVRRRFGFSDDDLELLEGWVRDSGMRWGLDVVDRRRDDVPLSEGTVQAGLSRILLGAAAADEDLRTLDGVTPLDGIEGADVALAGRLAELAARLDHTLTELRQDHPLQGWVDALTHAADLLLREPADEPWQRTQLTDLLTEVGSTAQAHGGGSDTVALSLAEVRALLADRLRGRPSWANHRTGDLTVCTLVPMRTVPHRVVCLLGMDDEVFPRHPTPDPDDLIARAPRVGDRDPRTEDRQLLLDALMAAEDAVIISYAGIDERTGQPRPPCVPVAELVRDLDRVLLGGAGDLVRDHPLHAHAPTAFQGAHRGFDPQALAGARASSAPPAPRDLLPSVPAAPVPEVVAVDRLISFAHNPVAHFYRHTVGAYVPEDPEAGDEQVPLTLGPLVGWDLGQVLLAHDAAADADRTDRVVAAARGRGGLPPLALGDRQITKVVSSTGDISRLMDRLGLPMAPRGRREVDVALGHRRMTGTIDCVDGTSLIALSYSKVKAKAIIAAWIKLLALTLDDPSRPWQAFVIGRHETKKVERRNAPHAVHLAPLGATSEAREETARAHLLDLLDLHDDGLREPLVVPASSACAYAIERVLRRSTPDEADDRAAERWDHDDFGFGMDADLPAHLLLFGDAVPYDVLRRQPIRPADVPSGAPPEPHRFGGLAVRLWAAPLRGCKVAIA